MLTTDLLLRRLAILFPTALVRAYADDLAVVEAEQQQAAMRQQQQYKGAQQLSNGFK